MDVQFNGSKIGSVELLETFGSEDTIAKVARVCKGVNPSEHSAYSKEANENLLNTLVKLKHHRPLEFASVLVYFEAPIFVERQFRTYRKPDLERSLRTCKPRFLPTGENDIDVWTKKSFFVYHNLVCNGMSREEARRVLPLNTMTAWVSLFSVRSLIHVFEERLAPAAQGETREFTRVLYNLVIEQYPTIFPSVSEPTGDALADIDSGIDDYFDE